MVPESQNWATEEFVGRLKNKEINAFEELLRHFGPHLLKFGMKMCRKEEDALDIYQDTLERAFLSIDQLKEPRALKTWLFRVAANACLMKRRKPKSFGEEFSIEEAAPDGDFLEKAFWLNNLPEKAMEEKELQEKMKEAIISIPESYRSVLLLRDMEGFSTEETAEIMNLSKGVVKMRLHRARAMVRKELSGYLGER